MSVDGLAGFWSYTHNDDKQSDGQLTSLARDLSAEFEMLSGEDFLFFVDRKSIQWGDEWRSRIANALDALTFFFPIITPRYFRSKECRSELLRFAGEARSLRVEELILPLLYVDVPDLIESSSDEAKALVARMQRVDIRELRFMESGSVTHRRLVHDLGSRLVEIVDRVSSIPRRTSTELATEVVGATESDDDEPGLLDLVAKVEEDLPRWNATIERFPGLMVELRERVEIAQLETDKGEAEGKGFGHRVVVMRRLAEELSTVASRFMTVGELYASQLLEVDPGVRALIRMAVESRPTGDDRVVVCEFFENLRGLVRAAKESGDMLAGLVATIGETGRLSRDLRPVLRQIGNALRGVHDGLSIIEDWERQIDESGIDCSALGA